MGDGLPYQKAMVNVVLRFLSIELDVVTILSFQTIEQCSVTSASAITYSYSF